MTTSRPGQAYGEPGLASPGPRFRWWPLVPIFALALVLRLWVIDRDALWLDEGYSWWDAHERYASLWTLVPQCDPHPPLYFALLHLWMDVFSDATVPMRALSTLLGMATVLVVFAAGRVLDRARGRADASFGIGTFAALLFAATPFQIYFSIEARPYALLCFGAALLTLGCLEAVAAPDVKRRTWILIVVGAVIAVWTNNTSVLVMGAVTTAFVVAWVFDRESRASMWPMIRAGVLVAAIWAPDWPLLLAQAHEVSDAFWIPPPTLEGVQFELHNLIGLDVLRSTWWVLATIVGGLVLIGLKIGRRWALMVGALALLPLAFNVAISVLVSPILISRALIGAAPALALALAAAAVLIGRRPLKAVAIASLVAVHAIAVAKFINADHVKEPWKPVVARLAKLPASTPILVVPNELALPLGHQAQTQGRTFRVEGVPADYPANGLDAHYPSGKCAPSVIGQDLEPLMRRLAGEPAVVLLTRRNNTYDPDEVVAAALQRSGYRLEGDETFQPGDLRIMRFVRRPS